MSEWPIKVGCGGSIRSRTLSVFAYRTTINKKKSRVNNIS